MFTEFLKNKCEFNKEKYTRSYDYSFNLILNMRIACLIRSPLCKHRASRGLWVLILSSLSSMWQGKEGDSSPESRKKLLYLRTHLQPSWDWIQLNLFQCSLKEFLVNWNKIWANASILAAKNYKILVAFCQLKGLIFCVLTYNMLLITMACAYVQGKFFDQM